MPSRARLRPNASRLTALVCGLLFVDLALWFAVIPLLPRWERDFGLSKSQSGIVLGAYSLSVLVASLPLGRLTDRFGAKRMTVAATVLFALVTPTLAFADEFWELVAIRLIQGLFSATSWTAGLAWMLALVPSSQRARHLALTNAAAGVAAFAGPAVGGPLVSSFGLEPVMVGFGTLVALFALWSALEPDARGDEQERASTTRELALGLRAPKIRASYAAVLFIAWASGTMQLLSPLHLSDAGLSDASVGWVFTALAVVSLAITLLISRIADRIDRIRTMIGSMIAIGIGHAVLAASLPVPGYVGAMIATSLCSSPLYIFSYALCSTGAEESGIGAGLAIGSLNSIWAGGTLVAPIAAGAIAGAVGDALPFSLTILAAVLGAGALVQTRRADTVVAAGPAANR